MLVDSHCHLDFADFEPERDAVVQRALDAGIKRMVTISTRVRKFDTIRAIAEAYESVYCSVGTHPNNAHEELDITADDLVRLAEHPKVVAIHARSAVDDMAEILEHETEKGTFPFILHCFSSGRALAEKGIELGGYISFSGILTFKNSPEIREIASIVPRNRLLVETDAPFLAPLPHRGKRNEPSFVQHTAAMLAETIGVSNDEVARITSDNVFRLFSKMPRPSEEN